MNDSELYYLEKDINTQIKYNINYDKSNALNVVCAKYLTNLINEGVIYNLTEEDKKVLLLIINNLLK